MSINPFAKYLHEVVSISERFIAEKGRHLNEDEIKSLLIALEDEEDDYFYQKWIIDNFPEMVYPDVLENFRQEVERRNLN